MAKESRPPSKLRIVLIWSLVFGSILFWTILAIWRASQHPAMEPTPALGHFIFMIIVGGFFLGMGICGYLVVIATHGFTFNFQRPVWSSVKKRVYLCNIIVPLMVMLGVGFLLSAWLTPLLNTLNMPGTTAFMVPVMGSVFLLQMTFIWVLIWSPLEKRIIQQRLQALGVTREQMGGGLYIGLSNPAITASRKRFFSIEEDVGMLWFTPEQMIYWGDIEQFGIGQNQLIQLERRIDAKSTAALSGTAYVILHIRLADGKERQIRLHTEGIWTLSGKRRASNELAARISAWHTPLTVEQ